LENKQASVCPFFQEEVSKKLKIKSSKCLGTKNKKNKNYIALDEFLCDSDSLICQFTFIDYMDRLPKWIGVICFGSQLRFTS